MPAAVIVRDRRDSADHSGDFCQPFGRNPRRRQRRDVSQAARLEDRAQPADDALETHPPDAREQILRFDTELLGQRLERGSAQREHALTYLFISHSMPLVRYLSTRIAVMERGRLVETGEAVALCANPQQAYTRQLIAATPELPSAVA